MTPPTQAPSQTPAAQPNQNQDNLQPTHTSSLSSLTPTSTSSISPTATPQTPSGQVAPGTSRPRRADCSVLYAGDHVYLPDDPACHFVVYPVKPGDTLARIANHFKQNAREVCQLKENGHLRDSKIPDHMRKWLEDLQAADKE